MKGIVAVAVAGVLAASLLGCTSEPKVMPDVVGMTYSEAKEALDEVTISSYDFDVTDKNGMSLSIVANSQGDAYFVDSQSIAAGTEIDKYSDDFELTLVVSNPEVEAAAEEYEAEKAAKAEEKAAEEAEKDAARQEALKRAAAEEAESIEKWGEDYLKAEAAIAAMEMYGREMYPYGFELHTYKGKIAEEHEEDGSWFFKFTCDVTNEYGATEKNLNCEAQIAGTDSDPVVTYFEVY